MATTTQPSQSQVTAEFYTSNCHSLHTGFSSMPDLERKTILIRSENICAESFTGINSGAKPIFKFSICDDARNAELSGTGKTISLEPSLVEKMKKLFDAQQSLSQKKQELREKWSLSLTTSGETVPAQAIFKRLPLQNNAVEGEVFIPSKSLLINSTINSNKSTQFEVSNRSSFSFGSMFDEPKNIFLSTSLVNELDQFAKETDQYTKDAAEISKELWTKV